MYRDVSLQNEYMNLLLMQSYEKAVINTTFPMCNSEFIHIHSLPCTILGELSVILHIYSLTCINTLLLYYAYKLWIELCFWFLNLNENCLEKFYYISG